MAHSHHRMLVNDLFEGLLLNISFIIFKHVAE